MGRKKALKVSGGVAKKNSSGGAPTPTSVPKAKGTKKPRTEKKDKAEKKEKAPRAKSAYQFFCAEKRGGLLSHAACLALC